MRTFKFKIRQEVREEEQVVKFFLKPSAGGGVVLQAEDGNGNLWTILGLSPTDGKIKLYSSIIKDIGFAVDDEGRVRVKT